MSPNPEEGDVVVKLGGKQRKQARTPRRSNQKDRLWTFDEMLAELDETNQPTELWDGELIMAPAPTPHHQDVVFRLARAMTNFVELRKLGKVYVSPLDVVLTQRRVVQPDIIYISREHSAILRDRIRGVPDLLVEVISPGSWRRDRVDKKALYEQHGVKEYWTVDLEAETIDVWTLEEGSYTLLGRSGRGDIARSQLLPGLEVAVDQVLG